MKKKELRAEIERLERENSNIRGENNVLAVQVKDLRETAQQHKRHILALQEQNERHIENIRIQTILARAYRDRWIKYLER